jgi:hypothetical protein
MIQRQPLLDKTGQNWSHTEIGRLENGHSRNGCIRRLVAFSEDWPFGDWLFKEWSLGDWLFGDWMFRDWSFGDWSFGDWSFRDWSFGEWTVYPDYRCLLIEVGELFQNVQLSTFCFFPFLTRAATRYKIITE